VLDFFRGPREIAETARGALRAYMADTAQATRRDRRDGRADAEVDATVGRMNASPNRSSERYLRERRLRTRSSPISRAKTDENTPADPAGVRTPAKIATSRRRPPRRARRIWRDQITFEQLVEMYRKDARRIRGIGRADARVVRLTHG